LLYLIGLSSSLAEAKSLTDTAAHELARVAEIVTQTLRFYRDPSKPTLVHVSEIVDSALALYQPRLASADIVIERDFRDCSPILAMPGELRQVTLNLIGNAFDAIGHGGRMKIRTANARQHSNGSLRGVRLTIADTGTGVQPEVRSSLFEPFVSTKGDTGTGLGLWLSSQIVTANPPRPRNMCWQMRHMQTCWPGWPRRSSMAPRLNFAITFSRFTPISPSRPGTIRRNGN
jgi:signal transduction histidine kinase